MATGKIYFLVNCVYKLHGFIKMQNCIFPRCKSFFFLNSYSNTGSITVKLSHKWHVYEYFSIEKPTFMTDFCSSEMNVEET